MLWPLTAHGMQRGCAGGEVAEDLHETSMSSGMSMTMRRLGEEGRRRWAAYYFLRRSDLGIGCKLGHMGLERESK